MRGELASGVDQSSRASSEQDCGRRRGTLRGVIVKRVLRWIAHWLFADYSFYRIYCSPANDREAPKLPSGVQFIRIEEQFLRELRSHRDPAIRKTARYGEEGTYGFALTRSGAPLSLAFYADRDSYQNDTIWALAKQDAALLEILTVEDCRGEGLAPLLIQLSSHAMGRTGKDRLIAWIWWSHRSSQRAFDKAGWRRLGFTASLTLRGMRSPLTWRKTSNRLARRPPR